MVKGYRAGSVNNVKGKLCLVFLCLELASLSMKCLLVSDSKLWCRRKNRTKERGNEYNGRIGATVLRPNKQTRMRKIQRLQVDQSLRTQSPRKGQVEIEEIGKESLFNCQTTVKSRKFIATKSLKPGREISMKRQ